MDRTASSYCLTINAGSSSIKFSVVSALADAPTLLTGSIDGIGGKHASFHVRGALASDTFERHFPIPEQVTAVNVLVDWLTERLPAATLTIVAHRVVHGGPECGATALITPALLAALYTGASSDPEHLPQEIRLIEALRRRFPQAAHVACFDSAFHATMPRVASMLPIPHRYDALGIKRYGFHGISCAYLMHALRQLDSVAASGKVILAHLGSGSSVTAVEQGASRDTTMGMTPASGMPTAHRSGDLDPGLAWYFHRHEQMTPAQFHHMTTHESGLLGVSGSTGDMHDLLVRQHSERRAAEAVALYCYHARKAVCAMAGAIDGIDTLVFAGGIGEHAAEVRERICAGLHHLGVELDAASNASSAGVISSAASRVCVRVLHTDEEWMIADEARRLLGQGAPTVAAEAAHG
jgi:acetate kinase